MSERRKHTYFVRQLMWCYDCDQCRQLQSQINQAERDERCIRSALVAAMMLALLSAAGLGYSAVLLPEFFDNGTPLCVKIFTVLLIGSTISSLGFTGFLYWYRRLCNQLYHECRRLIIALQNSKAAPVPELISISSRH
jgi:hypothetical protein